jgi:hypothetical protein
MLPPGRRRFNLVGAWPPGAENPADRALYTIRYHAASRNICARQTVLDISGPVPAGHGPLR